MLPLIIIIIGPPSTPTSLASPPPVPATTFPLPTPTTTYPRPGNIPPDDLPTHIHKHLLHILAPPCTRLVVRHIFPCLTDRESPTPTYAAVVFEIRFVAYEHNRHVRVVLDVDDLFAEFGEFLQGGEGSDGENEQEALGFAHVEFSKQRLGWERVAEQMWGRSDTAWRLFQWLDWLVSEVVGGRRSTELFCASSIHDLEHNMAALKW